MSQIHADSVPEEDVKNREVLRDLTVGGLSIAAALTLGISHVRQDGRLHDDYGAEPGPAMLPELLLTALAVTGVLLILRGLLRRRSGETIASKDSEEDTDGASDPIWAFGVLAISILACLAYPFAGFGLSAAILGAALCSLLAYQENRSVPHAALEGLAVALLLYGVFRFVLSVPLT